MTSALCVLALALGGLGVILGSRIWDGWPARSSGREPCSFSADFRLPGRAWVDSRAARVFSWHLLVSSLRGMRKRTDTF